MKSTTLLVLGVTLTLASVIQGANILAMLPGPFYSHTNSFKPIIIELAKRGHNVTMVSPYPEKKKVENLTEIFIPDIYSQLFGLTDPTLFIQKPTFFTDIIGIVMMGSKFGPLLMEIPEFQQFLQDSSHFDLVMCETFFMQEYFVAFGHKYSAPVISLNPAEPFFLNAYYTGNLQPYAYVPYMGLPITDYMNFYERLLSSVKSFAMIQLGNFYHLYNQENAMRKYMNESNGFKNLPPLKKMLANTSLTLLDYHFSVGFQRPFHTNMVEFGGLSLKHATDPLPKEFQTLLDEAKDGVIYLSFGSHFNVSLLPESNRQAIFGALFKVKQRVIMKWPKETLPASLPKHITVKEWLPQAAILAHPNCKMFITHGGVHGVYESLNQGVPVVGIPVFGDQVRNMIFAEKEGFGVWVDRFDDMTEEKMTKAINKVLSSPSFREAAKRRSKIMKDRPLPPLENAIYWIEYVLRHEGAPHLRPASTDLPLYQYLLLDVLAVLLLAALLPIYILILLIRWCCCRKPSSKKHKKD